MPIAAPRVRRRAPSRWPRWLQTAQSSPDRPGGSTDLDLDTQVAAARSGRPPMVKRDPELSPAAMDSAAHGADLDVEHRADLLVAQALDVAEHDRGAKLRRQGGQGGRDVVIEVGVGQLLRRSGPTAGQPV